MKKIIWFLSFLGFGFCLKPLYVPKTLAQEKYQQLLESKKHPIVIAEGPAGTGKTAFAVQQAILSLHEPQIHKIVLTRPVVSPDDGIGFLKGDLNQKMDPWVAPLLDVLKEFYPTSKIKQWLREGVIEIAPFSFLRGRTFKNAFVIADETQNATPEQIQLLLTRLGIESKLVLTGDLTQSDLIRKKDGLQDLLERLETRYNIKGIGMVRFESTDSQRHYLMPSILELYHQTHLHFS